MYIALRFIGILMLLCIPFPHFNNYLNETFLWITIVMNMLISKCLIQPSDCISLLSSLILWSDDVNVGACEGDDDKGKSTGRRVLQKLDC